VPFLFKRKSCAKKRKSPRACGLVPSASEAFYPGEWISNHAPNVALGFREGASFRLPRFFLDRSFIRTVRGSHSSPPLALPAKKKRNRPGSLPIFNPSIDPERPRCPRRCGEKGSMIGPKCLAQIPMRGSEAHSVDRSRTPCRIAGKARRAVRAA
jgi:hypothetical protein